MSQLSLFDAQRPQKPVNVASVPKRSPFRYPGGKTWLIPRIRDWLTNRPRKAVELYEPFAGGGIVSLTVAAEQLAEHVTMIELDEQVAAVWETLINDPDGPAWLSERILAFDLTPETVKSVLESQAQDHREYAFQTVLKNRTYHGGILAPGSSLLKYGENGKGIASRWYPTTLAHRIREIAAIRERISFVHGDGLSAMEAHAAETDAVWFIDPPYTAGKKGKRAGKRLYNYFELDHDRLFDIAQTLAGDFLMTYDVDQELLAMAEQRDFYTAQVAMQNTHLAVMNELLIGRSLSWLTS